jgi:hypothetical protein
MSSPHTVQWPFVAGDSPPLFFNPQPGTQSHPSYTGLWVHGDRWSVKRRRGGEEEEQKLQTPLKKVRVLPNLVARHNSCRFRISNVGEYIVDWAYRYLKTEELVLQSPIQEDKDLHVPQDLRKSAQEQQRDNENRLWQQFLLETRAKVQADGERRQDRTEAEDERRRAAARYCATVQDISEEEIVTKTNKPMRDARAIIESAHSADEEAMPQESESKKDGYIHNESDFIMETSRDTSASPNSANNSVAADVVSRSSEYCATVDDDSEPEEDAKWNERVRHRSAMQEGAQRSRAELPWKTNQQLLIQPAAPSSPGQFQYEAISTPKIPELEALPGYLRPARIPAIPETTMRRSKATVYPVKKSMRFSLVTSPVRASTHTSKLWEGAILKARSVLPASAIAQIGPVGIPGYNVTGTSTIVEKGVSKGIMARDADQQSSTSVKKPVTGAGLGQPTNTNPTSPPARPAPVLVVSSQKIMPKSTTRPLSSRGPKTQNVFTGDLPSMGISVQGADQSPRPVSKSGLGHSILKPKTNTVEKPSKDPVAEQSFG